MSIYDLSVKTINRTLISMKEYKGKVLLIVNTATGCGFTPQYEGLEILYKKYKDLGFEVLDFPSNQFKQAQGSDEEISNFCKLNYRTTFTTFAKIEVNGKNEDLLFTYLKKNNPKSGLLKSLLGDPIKWNFTKFLVDQNGNVVKRYEPNILPRDIDQDINNLLILNK